MTGYVSFKFRIFWRKRLRNVRKNSWSVWTLIRCSPKDIFTKRQSFRLVQIQSICRRQRYFGSNTEFCLWEGRKHCGKRRKWLPAFSTFHIMFLKVLIWGSLICTFKPYPDPSILLVNPFPHNDTF